MLALQRQMSGTGYLAFGANPSLAPLQDYQRVVDMVAQEAASDPRMPTVVHEAKWHDEKAKTLEWEAHCLEVSSIAEWLGNTPMGKAIATTLWQKAMWHRKCAQECRNLMNSRVTEDALKVQNTRDQVHAFLEELFVRNLTMESVEEVVESVLEALELNGDHLLRVNTLHHLKDGLQSQLSDPVPTHLLETLCPIEHCKNVLPRNEKWGGICYHVNNYDARAWLTRKCCTFCDHQVCKDHIHPKNVPHTPGALDLICSKCYDDPVVQKYWEDSNAELLWDLMVEEGDDIAERRKSGDGHPACCSYGQYPPCRGDPSQWLMVQVAEIAGTSRKESGRTFCAHCWALIQARSTGKAGFLKGVVTYRKNPDGTMSY